MMQRKYIKYIGAAVGIGCAIFGAQMGLSTVTAELISGRLLPADAGYWYATVSAVFGASLGFMGLVWHLTNKCTRTGLRPAGDLRR